MMADALCKEDGMPIPEGHVDGPLPIQLAQVTHSIWTSFMWLGLRVNPTPPHPPDYPWTLPCPTALG